MASNTKPQTPPAENGADKTKAEQVSGSLFVANERALGLNEQVQELLLAEAKRRVEGTPTSISFKQIKHTIGKGFEVEYVANYADGK